jgi:hypothetical protein
MTLSCIVSRQEVVVAVALQCALYWTCYEAVTDANLEPPDPYYSGLALCGPSGRRLRLIGDGIGPGADPPRFGDDRQDAEQDHPVARTRSSCGQNISRAQVELGRI